MANEEEVKIVRAGRDAIAEWRRVHPSNFAPNLYSLDNADLAHASLAGADSRGVNLSGAILIGAD